jgi:hypothetical protein
MRCSGRLSAMALALLLPLVAGAVHPCGKVVFDAPQGGAFPTEGHDYARGSPPAIYGEVHVIYTCI